MRVAIITESFPPDVNGVAHCVLRVAELLTRGGHHPLVIAPRPPRAKRDELPVAAPAAGGPLDLVADGVTGFLVPPSDPGAFTGAVARLAADPAMRAAFGAAGRRTVLGRSWPALTVELLGHYSQVLGTPKRAKVTL